jgi:hypothetical protein
VVSLTPRPLYPRGKNPGTHWIGGWVGPRVGLDDMQKRKFLTVTGLELQLLGRPSGSQSLYRLRYLGSYTNQGMIQKPLNLQYNILLHFRLQYSHCNCVHLETVILAQSQELQKDHKVMDTHTSVRLPACLISETNNCVGGVHIKNITSSLIFGPYRSNTFFHHRFTKSKFKDS